jgi:hypothetical protein
LSTEPDRNAAKGSITAKTQFDQGFSSTIEEGRSEQITLKSKKEENDHARAMAKISHGAVGGVLGTREEKPGNIAFIVIIICFFILFVAFLRMNLKDQFEQFMKIAGILTSIITASLGYLFGSANAK